MYPGFLLSHPFSAAADETDGHGCDKYSHCGIALEAALLRQPVADIIAIKPVLCRAGVASANHRLAAVKLMAGNEPQSAAARARHHGYIRILCLAELGL